jgi:hypothetical protein
VHRAIVPERRRTEILSFCTQHLAAFKVPKIGRLALPALPRDPNGKLYQAPSCGGPYWAGRDSRVSDGKVVQPRGHDSYPATASRPFPSLPCSPGQAARAAAASPIPFRLRWATDEARRSHSALDSYSAQVALAPLVAHALGQRSWVEGARHPRAPTVAAA